MWCSLGQSSVYCRDEPPADIDPQESLTLVSEPYTEWTRAGPGEFRQTLRQDELQVGDGTHAAVGRSVESYEPGMGQAFVNEATSSSGAADMVEKFWRNTNGSEMLGASGLALLGGGVVTLDPLLAAGGLYVMASGFAKALHDSDVDYRNRESSKATAALEVEKLVSAQHPPMSDLDLMALGSDFALARPGVSNDGSADTPRPSRDAADRQQNL